MQCKKCLIEIPAQFEYILSKNVCPKCGNKLMVDAAMKVYMDLKTRLHEVEFVMDKAIVCERIAMFLITNYEVVPFQPGKTSAVPTPVTAAEKMQENAADIAKFKAQLASIAEQDDSNLSAEEIRAEEAARAEELAIAREMGIDISMVEGEEMVSGKTDNDRVQRLKKLAAATKQIASTGQVGLIKRREQP